MTLETQNTTTTTTETKQSDLNALQQPTIKSGESNDVINNGGEIDTPDSSSSAEKNGTQQETPTAENIISNKTKTTQTTEVPNNTVSSVTAKSDNNEQSWNRDPSLQRRNARIKRRSTDIQESTDESQQPGTAVQEAQETTDNRDTNANNSLLLGVLQLAPYFRTLSPSQLNQLDQAVNVTLPTPANAIPPESVQKLQTLLAERKVIDSEQTDIQQENRTFQASTELATQLVELATTINKEKLQTEHLCYALEQNVETLKEEVEHQKATVNQLQAQLSTQTQRIETANKNRIATHSETVDNLRADISQTITNLETQNNVLRGQYNTNKTTIRGNEKQIKAEGLRNTDFSSLKSDKQRLITETQDLCNKQAQLETTIRANKKQLDVTKAIRNNLSRVVASKGELDASLAKEVDSDDTIFFRTQLNEALALLPTTLPGQENAQRFDAEWLTTQLNVIQRIEQQIKEQGASGKWETCGKVALVILATIAMALIGFFAWAAIAAIVGGLTLTAGIVGGYAALTGATSFAAITGLVISNAGAAAGGSALAGAATSSYFLFFKNYGTEAKALSVLSNEKRLLKSISAADTYLKSVQPGSKPEAIGSSDNVGGTNMFTNFSNETTENGYNNNVLGSFVGNTTVQQPNQPQTVNGTSSNNADQQVGELINFDDENVVTGNNDDYSKALNEPTSSFSLLNQ